MLVDDPGEAFVRLDDGANPYVGPLLAGSVIDGGVPAATDEPHWRHAGGDDPRAPIEAAVASVKRAKRKSNWQRKALAAIAPEPGA